MNAKHRAEHSSVPLPASNVSVSEIGKYSYVYHICLRQMSA